MLWRLPHNYRSKRKGNQLWTWQLQSQLQDNVMETSIGRWSSMGPCTPLCLAAYTSNTSPFFKLWFQWASLRNWFTSPLKHWVCLSYCLQMRTKFPLLKHNPLHMLDAVLVHLYWPGNMGLRKLMPPLWYFSNCFCHK